MKKSNKEKIKELKQLEKRKKKLWKEIFGEDYKNQGRFNSSFIL